jgi:hypothetical protein
VQPEIPEQLDTQVQRVILEQLDTQARLEIQGQLAVQEQEENQMIVPTSLCLNAKPGAVKMPSIKHGEI